MKKVAVPVLVLLVGAMTFAGGRDPRPLVEEKEEPDATEHPWGQLEEDQREKRQEEEVEANEGAIQDDPFIDNYGNGETTNRKFPR